MHRQCYIEKLYTSQDGGVGGGGGIFSKRFNRFSKGGDIRLVGCMDRAGTTKRKCM